RAPRSRRHRRPHARDLHHARLRARGLQRAPPQAGGDRTPGGAARMSASEGITDERERRILMSVPEAALVPAPPAIPVRRVRRILLAAGAVFAVLFLAGVVPRLMLRYRLRTAATAV